MQRKTILLNFLAKTLRRKTADPLFFKNNYDCIIFLKKIIKEEYAPTSSNILKKILSEKISAPVVNLHSQTPNSSDNIYIGLDSNKTTIKGKETMLPDKDDVLEKYTLTQKMRIDKMEKNISYFNSKCLKFFV